MAGKGKGYRRFILDGTEVLVGKGAPQNDRLTFEIADPEDFWLHAAGYAGSHVVIRNLDGAELPPAGVLERAATLAAWHSKARGARGKVEVHWCRVREVRKPARFPAGKVLLGRWETIKVYARELPLEES